MKAKATSLQLLLESKEEYTRQFCQLCKGLFQQGFVSMFASVKEKNKQRALIALKHKKFIEKELEKAMGAQVLLEETIKNIESAQMDVNIYEAMK
jgi:ribosomal protein S8